MHPRTLAAALTLGVTSLAAQVGAAAVPAPRLGFLAGLNSATLVGEPTLNEGETLDRRNGAAGGVYLALPLGATGLAFRPELLYVQKGVRSHVATPSPYAVDVRATIRLSYAEAPLLLQYTVPTAGRLRPQFYFGPAIALRTGCQLVARVEADTPAETSNVACDDLGAVLAEDAPSFRRVDVGGVAGGALAFDLGDRALTVGARYTHGLRSITRDPRSGTGRSRCTAVSSSRSWVARARPGA